MYILEVLLLLSSVLASVDPVIVCDGVMFHGVYHDKDLLFEGLGRVFNLVIHSLSGLLFFSHTIWNGTTFTFALMSCHLEKKRCRNIPGVVGAYAVAHDKLYNDIYFGGRNGLYRYNFRTKQADYFAEKDKSIWSIFIDVNFYYIEYPSQKLHILDRHGKFRVEPNLGNIKIDSLFISKQKTLYYSNSTGLFKVKSDFRSPVHLDHRMPIRRIAEDMFGEVYFCLTDGIYIENKPFKYLKKVVNIDKVYSIAFMNVFKPSAKDLLIYSTRNAIYRLLPSKHSQLCRQSIEKEENKKIELHAQGTNWLKSAANRYFL